MSQHSGSSIELFSFRMVRNHKNISLVTNFKYPFSENPSRTHHSITTFSGTTSVQQVQASYLSWWTRMVRMGETVVIDNRVSVCFLFLVQRDGTSIHWTPGVSKHVPARLQGEPAAQSVVEEYLFEPLTRCFACRRERWNEHELVRNSI